MKQRTTSMLILYAFQRQLQAHEKNWFTTPQDPKNLELVMKTQLSIMAYFFNGTNCNKQCNKTIETLKGYAKEFVGVIPFFQIDCARQISQDFCKKNKLTNKKLPLLRMFNQEERKNTKPVDWDMEDEFTEENIYGFIYENRRQIIDKAERSDLLLPFLQEPAKTINFYFFTGGLEPPVYMQRFALQQQKIAKNVQLPNFDEENMKYLQHLPWASELTSKGNQIVAQIGTKIVFYKGERTIKGLEKWADELWKEVKGEI